ncbi:sirohydrochlorin chelatase [Uliginosibacterium aquaticum]|uniref:CbiX/SirB N-terminal domain-containing protein n=1 Tax=Uliginosibacterium aquaticum TaxID=2731212 RepID=A0ABX2INF7_9RHOO|nr:CbiX/SirB N-terminal domain-containing protein [Uliginosibacterium aquaticum]NSL56229.1 CbiX/SirB N-terminal domain-containing protein [Uliginosibacterium aquaticum]
MHSIILFAHGARDPEWARPLQRLREAVLARRPEADVRLAFLEFMTPSLPEAIDAAAAVGATDVAVVPVFLAQGGHVRRDVPAMLETACARHPALEIRLQPVLGEAQSVLDAMAEVVLAG